MIELALEALECREWPRTEVEIHLFRSAMFDVQALIRGMERVVWEEEIAKISRNISKGAPEKSRKSERVWFAGAI